ncbi:hypothetical protein JCM19045_9 [Bacillus sp. JCM 19045]|nr:hypothetical protein JCM19045_9 [Bacillus sp. JCM 19045]
MNFSRLKSLINPNEVELLFSNKKQNKMVEAFHKYNNVVDPETSLALVLDETNYTLIEFQRDKGFTRANFDQQGVAIAAFYVLVMGTFQRQGIDQPIQKKLEIWHKPPLKSMK